MQEASQDQVKQIFCNVYGGGCANSHSYFVEWTGTTFVAFDGTTNNGGNGEAWDINYKADYKIEGAFSNFDGTWNGDVTAGVAGISGTAYSFDGSGDYVEINGLKSSIAGTTELSVTAWVKPDDNVDETIIGIWDGSGNDDKIFDIHINGGGYLELSLRDGGTNYITTSSTIITEGDWQHIGFTYDGGSTTVKLYINGVLDATDESNPSSLHTGTGSPELIGIYGDRSSSAFDGVIDEMSIWTDVLSDEEVAILYLSLIHI